MNLLAVFLGGIPVCHGSGGLAAHYRFGARTGGAMIIIGVILLALSILHEQVLYQLLHSIPFSILGVFLFFAGLQLTMAVKKVLNKNELLIALLIAILSISFRYGYLIGLVVGITLSYAIKKWKCF
jgi:MFS superfamily sulfate permease-like transporter